MPDETPQSIKHSMNDLVARYQNRLDEFADEITTVLPSGLRKYTLAERADLNNLRANLVEQLFNLQVTAAFDTAAVTVVSQPTEAEVESLKATLVELAKPLDQLSDARAVLAFVNGLATNTTARINKLASALSKV